MPLRSGLKIRTALAAIGIEVAGAAYALIASAGSAAEASSSLEEDAAAEVLNAIRPGGEGVPYWNGYARWFMYRPVIGFPSVEGATNYVFTVLDDYQREATFAAKDPCAEFSAEFWKRMPVGYFTLRAAAETPAGVREIASRRYWKLAPFKPGAYPVPSASYREAARKAYDYAFEFGWLQTFLKTGRPDPSYNLNCYPSKMHSALIKAMVRYAKMRPDRRDEALKLARLAADYLISVSEGPDRPLACFPPTYAAEPEYKKVTAVTYEGQTMILYPAEAASAFFTLFRATGEVKYKAAGAGIVRTFLKLQGEDGTWPLKLYLKDGRSVVSNRVFPATIVTMLEEAYGVMRDEAVRSAADRAFGYLDRHSFATFDWEGQFEDVRPMKPYEDLSHHPACDAAILLLGRFPNDSARRWLARECVRFAEDQFTCWEVPARGRGDDLHGIRTDEKCSPWQKNYHEWTTTPAVVEQYAYTAPVDASVAKMVLTYLAMYKAERRPLDLAKAKAMADALVRAQQPSGRIPTIWTKPDLANIQSDWVNCLFASARALSDIADIMDTEAK